MNILKITMPSGKAFMSHEHTMEQLAVLYKRWAKDHPEEIPKEPGFPVIERLEMTEQEYWGSFTTNEAAELFSLLPPQEGKGE